MIDSEAFAEEVRKLRMAHPDIVQVEALLPDSNGILRGKWLAAEVLDDLAKRGMRLPSSVFGETVRLASDLTDAPGLSVADPDGLCLPVPDTLRPVPWRERPTAQLLTTMYCNGEPNPLDPRHILATEERRWRALGWTPVVGVELEFCMFPRSDRAAASLRPPERQPATRLLEVDGLVEVEAALADICRHAEAQGVPVTTCVAEFAPNQYELNLGHVRGACRAGDLAVQFKRLVKETVAVHGLDATFMAQPRGSMPGNGCHVHCSVLDDAGRNLFDAGDSDSAAPMLLSAAAGCVESFVDLQLVFAPHANSCRRLAPRLGRIQRVEWGYDNREAAIRLPAWSGNAARLEHRLGGADAQPYLLLAALLAGMREGMEERLEAASPKAGRRQSGRAPRLTPHWHQSVDRFARSRRAARVFGSVYRELYARMKKLEAQENWERVSDIEYEVLYRRI